MEAYLVYNGEAGSVGERDASFYQRALDQAGFEPVYRVTHCEDDVAAVLESARGLVVVVGGDGSLRAVATRLVGRQVPIALVPAGTANNVGSALGLTGDPVAVIQGLAHPRKRSLDIGVVRAPWGQSYFLEGAGFGLFAEALARYRPEDGKSVLRGVKTLLEVLSELPAQTTRLRLNGQEEEGEYLLLDAMNTPAVGPRIPLARQADMSDGLLDLVRVEAGARDSYLAYLTGLLSGEFAQLDSVQVQRVREFEFFWTGFPIHQDAVYQQWERQGAEHGVWVRVEVLPAALELWLPGEPALCQQTMSDLGVAS
jgi:diacylglycerol kinase (ATP)